MVPALSDLAYVLKEHFVADPQWRPRPNLLTGRVVIVTGANTGLGLETAIQLGKLDPSLIILACRNTDKGVRAREKVINSTGLTEGRVWMWELDLASLASVNGFAQRCERELSRLDVLVQNAGMNTFNWVTTEDGFESTFQVNVLATGLLGVLLLPLLAKTATLPIEDGMKPFKPHITILASLGKHSDSTRIQVTSTIAD